MANQAWAAFVECTAHAALDLKRRWIELSATTLRPPTLGEDGTACAREECKNTRKLRVRERTKLLGHDLLR